MAELPPTPFSIMPDWEQPVEFTQEWATNIIPLANGGEQRIIQRQGTKLRYKFRAKTLHDYDSGQLETQLRAAPTFRFYVPLWHDSSWITANIAGGGVTVNCDTSSGDYVGGGTGFAMLWTSALRFDVVPITSVVVGVAGSLTLTTGPVNAYSLGVTRVMPIRIMRLVDHIPIERIAATMSETEFEFEGEVLPPTTAAVTPAVATIVVQQEGNSSAWAGYVGGYIVASAIAYDSAGVPIPNAPITWSVGGGGALVIDTQPQLIGSSVVRVNLVSATGGTTLTATSGSANATVSVSAAA